MIESSLVGDADEGFTMAISMIRMKRSWAINIQADSTANGRAHNMPHRCLCRYANSTMSIGSVCI